MAKRVSKSIRFLPAIFLCFLLLGGWPPGEAKGQEVVKVALLPFRVYAAEPGKVKDWSQRVSRTITAELAKDERIILAEEEQIKKAVAGESEIDEPLARDIGRLVDADYVVLGSITQINGSLSLDARIIDVHQPGVWVSVFVSGKGEENLERISRQLNQELNVRILKKERISKVLVEGHRAIEESAIRAQIKIKEGDIFSPRALREDLKAIFQLGYFQDVRAEKRDWDRGKAVVFLVEEKPVVKEIKFSGNKALKTSDLQEAIDLKPRTVLNLNTVKESVNKILQKYRDEAFYAAEVKSELETPRKGDVIVRFQIQEHKKIRIKAILFSGNFHFPDSQLKSLLPETKEKGFFSWVTKTGTYKEDVLERDLDAVLAFYFQKGFLHVKVGKPQMTMDLEGITINIPVEEGRQFRAGKVDIQGDLIGPKEELFKLVKVYPGEILNRDRVQESISNLADRYAEQGYAFVDVTPQSIIRQESSIVELNFAIHKGSQVYFERINILGNTKTRDKVIRRELKAIEGELYSLSGLKKSRENLNILTFFKEVNFSTKKGSGEDKLDLDIQVEEGPTGMFSVGGGYSSIDKVIGTIQISQTNLFGRGQRLTLSGQFGAISQYYNLGFTEPWLFDTRISAGGDLYRTLREYDDYIVQRNGGGVRFGFPLFEDFRGYSSYKYEKVDITDVKDTASLLIREQVGTSTTSSISVALRRDRRDHPLEPSKGSDNSVSMEYAGGPLGGSNYFTRYAANSSWFTTPFWKTTFMVRGRIGYIQPHGGRLLPLYERFRLGGINSIRGFKAYTIGPKATNGEVIGGDKELLFNLEAVFPLIPAIKLKGLVFFDAGNAYDVGEPYKLSDLRTSVGVGFRWISPIGPLRLEWGYNLKPKDDEQRQGWDFSVGTFF